MTYKGLDNFFGLKIVNIFLPISFNICFGCSKEPSQWDSSFEYPQHTFWLRNKKVNILVRSLNLRPDIYCILPHVLLNALTIMMYNKFSNTLNQIDTKSY